MPTTTVDAFVADLQLLGGEQHALVQQVRKLVRGVVPNVTESVKYGGILFAAAQPFCGVFAYKQHVSVELSQGANIDDTLGHLEGRGKGRRHIKLYTIGDIEDKALSHYLPLALQAMGH
ncbi:MAG: DUF1801 domain-containing protein [Pseudomonadota bacterium]